MNKRVHEIAKERGLPAKEVVVRRKGAGLEVKAASSSVDEAAAQRVLGNGEAPAAQAQAAPPRAPAATTPAAQARQAPAAGAAATVASSGPGAESARTQTAASAPDAAPDPAQHAGETNGVQD